MYPCYVCKEQKSVSEFYKDLSRSSGVSSKCKDCQKNKAREYRTTDEGKKKRVVLARKWKRDNKEKENAHKKVARAIKVGKLVKPTVCSICPSTEKIEGHHDDYDYPFIIRWLCQKCHLDHHRRIYATR